jgi:hypothetical protein
LGLTLVSTGVPTVTISKDEAEIPLRVADTVVWPTLTPVAMPWLPDVLLIVATVAVEDLHVTREVRSRKAPLGKVPVAVNCWVPPTKRDAFCGVTESDLSPAMVPVPVRFAICGLLLALSVTVRVPVRVPN